MTKIALQISPEAKTAYFADYLAVARAELERLFGAIPVEHRSVGPLEFFELRAEGIDPARLLRLSFVQGLYEVEGELLRPLDQCPDFRLHQDFVFGSKFKGKTNERLTQLLINVGLAAIGAESGEGLKLLDPMCGRATTLLWAMRYGLTARGIEQDARALDDIHRNLKKWSKLHRQKHKLNEGALGDKRSKQRFLDFAAEGVAMRVVTGDARHADQLYKKERFDLIISDLPYGVQHFTTEKTRNPLAVLEQCVAPWKACLKQGGAMVLAYNRNNPKRDALIGLFERGGLAAEPFHAEHRMSESIVRDVIILRHRP